MIRTESEDWLYKVFVFYLKPLRLVIVGGGPRIDFALFVQPGLARLPREHAQVEGLEDTGGTDLIILDVSGLHPHWLRAPCTKETKET